MAKADGSLVDAYVGKQPADVQPVLRRVRSIIRRALPGAEEGISYQIPTYKLHHEYVVYFAGWGHHWSGTIRFRWVEPVPARLAERIVRQLAGAADSGRLAKSMPSDNRGVRRRRSTSGPS